MKNERKCGLACVQLASLASSTTGAWPAGAVPAAYHERHMVMGGHNPFHGLFILFYGIYFIYGISWFISSAASAPFFNVSS